MKTVRLQDKLGKRNFHEDMKKVFELVTKSIKDVSEEVRKTITGTPNINYRALENLNDELLEVMIIRGILATYLVLSLSKITNPENTSQFKKAKDSSSNRNNDFVVHNSKPNTLHDNLLTIRDTGKELELKENLLKMITERNYNVDLASYRIKN